MECGYRHHLLYFIKGRWLSVPGDDTMNISVIVPVFNAAPFISSCVNSILSQTYQHFELILVDDCSTDDSVKICKRFEEQHSKIIVLQQTRNMGPMAARIEGTKKASGNYIVFCDADDTLPSNSLENLVNGYHQHSSDMVIGNFTQQYGKRFIENKNRLAVGIYNTVELLRFQIDDGTLSGMLISSQCAKLYKRTIIESFFDQLPIEVRINEDGIFNTHYLLHSRTVGVIDTCVYIQRNWKEQERKKPINLNLFEPANDALWQLKGVWPNREDFEIQWEARKLTILFWQFMMICNRSSIIHAYSLMKNLGSENNIKVLSKSVNYTKIRIYKRFFLSLMGKKMYMLFYLNLRWGVPLFRKFVPR